MSHRILRSLLASASLLALLAGSAQADLRVVAEPISITSQGVPHEQSFTIEAGPEHAGSVFVVVPTVDGVPQRSWMSRYDRVFGSLNAQGRAVVNFRLPRRSDLARPGKLPKQRVKALRAGISHHVTLFDGIGGPLQTVSSTIFAASTTSTGPISISVRKGNATAVGNVGAIDPSSALRVSLPRDGARVGSPSIDVSGRLAGFLNQSGTQVTVNGQPAQVFATSGSGAGMGRFLLTNLELSNGLNTLVIRASAPNIAPVRQDVTVTLDRLTSNNVVVDGERAYAARGTNGFAIVDLRTREYQDFAAPTERVDDLDVADGFLFLLDAQSGGNLSVMSLANPDQPVLVSGPQNVPVGPFAGVSARSNRVVVSGGTSLLTVRSYGAAGNLSTAVASTDLGIGQPDVLVSDDGTRAFVSTDFAGTVGGAGFGITTIQLNAPPTAPTVLSRTGLPGSGFSAGSQGPANFPIESALVNGLLVTAHGGGLSRISSSGALLGTTSLGFPGVSVDASAERVFVVGTGRRLAELDFSNPNAPQLLSTDSFPGPGGFTGVATSDTYIAIASNNGGLRVLRR